MSIFVDRTDAGRQLAAVLGRTVERDAVVLGIPRGGIVVAAAVAAVLGLPLDVAVVRKLGAPGRPEYAIGAVASGVRVVDETALRAARASTRQLSAIEKRERRELARREHAFPRTVPSLTDRVVIVVDDGVATGATATAACRSVRLERPARLVLAVPVAPREWVPDPRDVDEYVCPHRVSELWSVGRFYQDFTQTADEEVTRLLSGDLPH